MGNFTSSTVPDPPVQNIVFEMTIIDDLDLFDGGLTYELLLDATTFTNYTLNGVSSITFHNVISSTSGSVPFVLSDSIGNTWDNNLEIDPICYVIGTQILCFVDNEEKYIKIENLKENDLIKTYKNGYKKIVGIVSGKNIPSKVRDINRIYKLNKNKISHNEPFEDLYVTGAHSILVDSIDDKLINILSQIHGGLDRMKIENKYKLLVSMSDLFEISKNTNTTLTYQIALENINDYDHYGIYANGVLSESMNIQNYKTSLKNLKIFHPNYINVKDNCS
jgi:hypothetical protein